MEIINELLGRPLLKIYQDPEIFNFSLDSILLANFCSIPAKTKKNYRFRNWQCPYSLIFDIAH